MGNLKDMFVFFWQWMFKKSEAITTDRCQHFFHFLGHVFQVQGPSFATGPAAQVDPGSPPDEYYISAAIADHDCFSYPLIPNMINSFFTGHHSDSGRLNWKRYSDSMIPCFIYNRAPWSFQAAS